MNKPDPKYLGIPNIQFSLTDKDDDREVAFAVQRKERGFDDSETWSLANTFASFMIPRLERFRKLDSENSVRTDEFIEELDIIINTLKLIDRDNGLWDWGDDESKTVHKGLNLLSKNFLSLWW